MVAGARLPISKYQLYHSFVYAITCKNRDNTDLLHKILTSFKVSQYVNKELRIGPMTWLKIWDY